MVNVNPSSGIRGWAPDCIHKVISYAYVVQYVSKLFLKQFHSFRSYIKIFNLLGIDVSSSNYFIKYRRKEYSQTHSIKAVLP
jgi:hypothetical protein